MVYCQRCGFQGDSRGMNDNPQLQLEEVEEEMLQLKDQLSKLLIKHTALKQQINSQSSPLLRLPSEIIREISVAAFPSGSVGKDGNINEWSSTTPFLLGSICSTWRDIAWSTPQLWSTVYVEVQDESQYRPSKASLLEEWLQRSLKLPISVCLRLTYLSSRSNSVMWKIMDLVASHSERWQDVHLDMPYFFEEGNCSVPNSFPQLRSLSIANPNLPFGEHANMFQYAPVLNEVSLPLYPGARLPINSLSSVTITGSIRSNDCLQLLASYPHLVHCAFPLISGLGSAHQKVEALSLRSLEIYPIDYGIEVFSPFLDNLLIPSLHELTIRTDVNLLFPHRRLASILWRSACPLVRLTLHGIRMSDAELIECLAIIPSLRELDLEDIAIGTHAIRELTLREDDTSPILVPQLLSLVLTVENRFLFDFAALAKMAESRRQETADAPGGLNRLVAQMESLTIHLTGINTQFRGFTWVVSQQFQELEDGGMIVKIEMPGS